MQNTVIPVKFTPADARSRSISPKRRKLDFDENLCLPERVVYDLNIKNNTLEIFVDFIHTLTLEDKQVSILLSNTKIAWELVGLGEMYQIMHLKNFTIAALIRTVPTMGLTMGDCLENVRNSCLYNVQNLLDKLTPVLMVLLSKYEDRLTEFEAYQDLKKEKTSLKFYNETVALMMREPFYFGSIQDVTSSKAMYENRGGRRCWVMLCSD